MLQTNMHRVCASDTTAGLHCFHYVAHGKYQCGGEERVVRKVGEVGDSCRSAHIATREAGMLGVQL